MARIRSIHPGLASDEAFMCMSMAAKAAWSVLWTECDDHGLFEWKPVVLKARIFPADNVDFSALLAEYEGLDCVKRVEIDGKPYGCVRNFCRYQRPKHPSYRFPFPDELASYVGFSVKAPPQGGEASPPPPEKPPQMKEEGGSSTSKERDMGASRPSADDFEKFKAKYPKRGGSNPWTPAADKFKRAVKGGADPAEIILAAEIYARECDDRKITGTEKVAQAVTWLNQQRWRDYTEGIEAERKRREQAEADMAARGYAWDGEKWVKKDAA